MTSAEERLATLETMLRNLADDVADHHAMVMERLEGGPNVRREDSIRGRLHELETNSVAAKAAGLALSEAQRERASASSDRKATAEASNREFWRWVTACIAVAAIVAPYVERAF